MAKFRIGRHIHTRDRLASIPEQISKIGYQIFQIFLGVPHQILSKPKPENDLAELGKELEKYQLECVIHGSYTINLCHPSGNKLFQTSLKSLVQDLRSSAKIGRRCLGVIIHMGKNVKINGISNKKALDNYVKGLKLALQQSPVDTVIVLETGASQGCEIASKIEGLAEIYQSLNESEQSRIKFCIDTCHIFATGYDISTRGGAKSYFVKFNELIGIDKVACIHFNNSKTPLESHVDRHADLEYGYIKADGLKTIAQIAKKHRIPLIMETPLDSVNPETNQDVTFIEELDFVYSLFD